MNIGVIPARLKSSRLPEKILAPIGGIPMIIRVVRHAQKSKSLDKIIVAIDHKKTQEILNEYGMKGYWTSSHHQSGTDRVADIIKNEATDIVINIQGDEPEMEPELIDKLVDLFQNDTVKMATLASTDITDEDRVNPNVVKLQRDENGLAIDFSRESFSGVENYRHIGIYGFKKDTLLKFTSLPHSKRESMYKLEQLRALDNGIPIHTVITNYKGRGVDTKEDLKQLELKYAS